MNFCSLAAIARAKQNGAWESLDAAEAGLVPDDLATALAADATAARHFAACSLSARKGILTWVLGAKQPATRARRVAETVRLADLNKRANFDRE
ncbi:YdeI/OmpD-associated family protein [Hymenobacter sp. BT683]|uniref:YdeI/OmpD-associated family protein n=1 Tax=Hymenobacter jeongseonensis TaxID=2791027 RepID=A0ABS0ILL9_9BACT|nr:YdeI/OmpD-associated family protein [Hymenobacter jeongseonensis]MBF9238670.1 YdeI/OmpD-associated family protein [Hymenobacter jeongseonensis]